MPVPERGVGHHRVGRRAKIRRAIDGLCRWKDGKPVANPAGPFHKDIDDFGRPRLGPDRSEVLPARASRHDRPALSPGARDHDARAVPYSCTYWQRPHHGRKDG